MQRRSRYLNNSATRYSAKLSYPRTGVIAFVLRPRILAAAVTNSETVIRGNK